MNWGESTFPATSREAMVAAHAATIRRASPGGRARRSPTHRVHATPTISTTRTAVEMAEITAGPVPSMPWLPKELSTVTGMSASACSPSR